MGDMKDLTGQIFGDWKAIKFDDSKGKYKYYWECECINCGDIKSVATGTLLSEKKYRRCECNPNYSTPIDIKGFSKDLSGLKYGELEVIEFSHKEHSHSHWKCMCSCGGIVTKSIAYLNSKTSYKMCKGCLNKLKYGDKELKKQIEKSQKKDRNIKLFNKRENEYRFLDDYILINGKIKIDKDDYEKINDFNRYVYINSGSYALMTFKNEDYFIHRLIMGLPTRYDPNTKIIADHINGDRLDNRKQNLRIIEKDYNPINCKKYKNNTSGTKGVSYMKNLDKWQANINYKGKSIYLGVYKDIDAAIKVRKEAEKKYFGEFNREEVHG